MAPPHAALPGPTPQSSGPGPISDEAFVEELRQLVLAFPTPPSEQAEEQDAKKGGGGGAKKRPSTGHQGAASSSAANRFGSVLARGSNMLSNVMGTKA